MPSFGIESLTQLSTCDPKLIQLFNEVVKTYDCQVLQGARSIADEEADMAAGKSSLTNPLDSLHVVDPVKRPLALAADVAPYPVDWTLTWRFCHFAGYVLRIAEDLNIAIRWGGAWAGSYLVNPKGHFNDLPHFELVPK